MSYYRVIPRDLFNESKLLKCMGQLSLVLHDGIGIRWPLELEHEDPDQGFIIVQNPNSGGLSVVNLTLYLDGTPIALESQMNSKLPYPLIFEDETVGDFVFNDDGTFSREFKAWLDNESNQEVADND